MEQKFNLSTFISGIKEDIKELIRLRIEILRLETFEKASVVGSFVIYGLVIVNLVFFMLLFAFVALGFLISGWIQSMAGGFGIVSAFYLICLVAALLYHKPVSLWFKNLLLKELDSETEK
ncbi:hypothetical protein AGMMS50239_18060 [Bacteroidia bacterium]|nr:hypothetical protein FACS1894207_2600 [Bacteroidia bacterium]GHT63022.1 hypothetical protein AGMMS50239_18060 [Bacteroidia bacterium]